MSSASSNVPVVELSAPVADLMDELLHAMGQPLTTLQGYRLLPVLPASERADLIADMAEQVERVTDFYRDLRSLFAAERSRADTSTGPGCTLRTLEPEWQRLAARHDVTLITNFLPESPIPRRLSRRAQQAIDHIVQAALASTPATSQIRILATEACSQTGNDEHGVTVRCLIDTTSPTVSPISPKLSPPPPTICGALRMAQALLQAEGGRVVYNLQPFRATIELPGA